MAPSAVLSQKFPVLFSSQQISGVFTYHRVLHLWRAKETFIQKQLPQSAVKTLLIKAGTAASLQVCTSVSGSNIYEYFIIFAVSFGVQLDLTANREMDFATSDARPLCMIQLYQKTTTKKKYFRAMETVLEAEQKTVHSLAKQLTMTGLHLSI